MNRGHACEYDDKQQKSRTQLLKEQLSQLERRLHDLESGSRPSSAGAPSPPDTLDFDLGLTGKNDDASYNSQYPLFSFGSTSASPSPPSSDSGSGSVAPLMLFNSSKPRMTSEESTSSSPSTSILGGPSHTDPRSVLPSRAKQYLLDVFMAHRHQCWFYASMDRFLEPALHGNEPHPALINAMYLLACHFAHTQFYSELEPAFFVQVQHEINAALDTSDRLCDIVQASALLAVYLYMNNRVMEGYRHTFSAVKLAVGLGLHQIQPPNALPGVYTTATPLIPVAPPRTHKELDDRVFAFWQIFMIDRCWSVANSLPLALPDKDTAQCRILTPWPSTLGSDVWNPIGFQQPLRSFLQGLDLTSPSDETLPTLKAKAAALYELTSRSKN
ncbi:hypothetical protein H0H87_000340, partial [Tephrocybe sp. NHM501043]